MDKLKELAEIFNQRDDVVVDCLGISEEDSDFAFCWLTAKELSDKSYMHLAELANKIAAALFRSGINYTQVELIWLWGDDLKNEKTDTVPEICIEMLCSDIEAVIATTTNV